MTAEFELGNVRVNPSLESWDTILDAETHMGRIKIYIDGLDVTGRAILAGVSSRPGRLAAGWVQMVLVDENNAVKTASDGYTPLTEIRKGIVRWEQSYD